MQGFFNVAGAETILSGFDEDVLSTAFNVCCMVTQHKDLGFGYTLWII